MRTAGVARLRSATVWVKRWAAVLIRKRRGQLLVAVLFGALLGGGFVAASTGVSPDGRGHGPGFSFSQDPQKFQDSPYSPQGQGAHGNSGYDDEGGGR